MYARVGGHGSGVGNELKLKLNQLNHRIDRTHIGNTYTLIIKQNSLFRW